MNLTKEVEGIITLAAAMARQAVDSETSMDTLAGVIEHDTRKSVRDRAEVRLETLRRGVAQDAADIEKATKPKTKGKRVPVEPTTPAPDAARATVRKARGFGKPSDVPTVDVTKAPKASALENLDNAARDLALAALDAAMPVAEETVAGRVGRRLGKKVQALLEEPTEFDGPKPAEVTAELEKILATEPPITDASAGLEKPKTPPGSIADVAIKRGKNLPASESKYPSRIDALPHGVDSIVECTNTRNNPTCLGSGTVREAFGTRNVNGVLLRQAQCKKCRSAAARTANEAQAAKTKIPAPRKGFGKKPTAVPTNKKSFGKKN